MSLFTFIGNRFLSCSFAALFTAALAVPTQAAPQDTDPPGFVTNPVILRNPNLEVPLSAMITLETDEPTRVSLEFFDGVAWTGPFPADPELALVHDTIPVLGIHAGKTVRVYVTVTDAAGNSTQGPTALLYSAAQLPFAFPPIEVTVSQPGQMEPGVTLIIPRESRANFSWLVMLDEDGEVVWFYASTPERVLGDVRRMSNGHLLLILNRDTIVEMDMLGNVVQEWQAVGVHTSIPPGVTPVQTDSFHHEVIELPAGYEADFAVLSSEVRDYPNYPADEVDQSLTNPSTPVVGDVIVEFKRDGTIVNEWKLLDILDPYRLSYDSLGSFWNQFYGLTDSADWSHANAVILDPSDDAYIVSVRHQEAVVKISRSLGSLMWILGDNAGWNPPWSGSLLSPDLSQPEFNWPYHQHAPQLTVDGTIMMFDNGNGRAVPPAPPLPSDQRRSRAVEFFVDPVTRIIEQRWSYDRDIFGDPIWYSSFLGDADRLTNTVLITDGGKRVPGAVNLGFSRVVEVTHASPPEKVFEILVRDPNPLMPGAVSWTMYRSERLTSGVYP
ncbi:MAG: hypothetical protein E2O39_12290 [Planctomycetota bacterium]|nr:MAG: hypothetical protein E2O39_12290 [Planctomycetota bacterium]